MEKFKRYLGLAAAIALLVLAFIPVGPYLKLRLTPLDSTVLTHLTIREQRGTATRWWFNAAEYIVSCRPLQDQQTARGIYRGPLGITKCGNIDQLFNLSDPEREIAAVAAVEPALPALLSEYRESQQAEHAKSSASPALFAYYYPDGKVVRDPRNLELELQIGMATAKYLDRQRPEIVRNIYLVHGLLLIVVVLMVLGRELVGTVIWAPFSLVFGAASAGAKAAKGLHEKV